MLDTIRLLGYISPKKLNLNYFVKTATVPAGLRFGDLEDFVCRYCCQDRITGTLRVGHDGREPVKTFRKVDTKEGVKKISVIEGGQAYIEFAVSKYLWNTNLYEIGQPGIAALEQSLSEVIDEIFSGEKLTAFHLTRADVPFNFCQGSIQRLLRSLARMYHDRRQGMEYSSSYDRKTETVLWETRNQKSRFMFYNKFVEVTKELKGLQRKYKREGGRMLGRAVEAIEVVLEEVSENMIRCERKIAESRDLDKYGIRHLSDIKAATLKTTIEDNLNRLEVPISEYSDLDEILEVFEGELTLEEILRWYSIFQLRRKVADSDRAFVEEYGEKLGFSRATYQRYKKLFAEAKVTVKNLGEANLRGIRGELERRAKVWEKTSVSLNGEPREVEMVKSKDILESCWVGK